MIGSPTTGRTVPELAGVRLFLDVGSGIGLLAVAAAGVWPQATVVGIDVWGPSLTTLRIIRGGGADFDAKRLVAALEAVGCTAVQVVPRQGPAPMEHIIGRR